MTERDAAIHAARRLVLQFRFGQRFQEFMPILPPRRRLVIAAVVPFDLQKSGRLAHDRSNSTGRSRSTILTYIVCLRSALASTLARPNHHCTFAYYERLPAERRDRS